jgi:hypothetical protein
LLNRNCVRLLGWEGRAAADPGGREVTPGFDFVLRMEFDVRWRAARARGHPKLGGLAGARAGTAIGTENLSVKNSPMTELSARE